MPTLTNFRTLYETAKNENQREERLRRLALAERELARLVAPRYYNALITGARLDLKQSGEYDAYHAAVATVEIAVD